jgi:putative endonuclease
VDKRVSAHNAGKAAKYTRSRLPVMLVYKASFETKTEAMKAEYAIKQLSREEKLRLIENQ